MSKPDKGGEFTPELRKRLTEAVKGLILVTGEKELQSAVRAMLQAFAQRHGLVEVQEGIEEDEDLVVLGKSTQDEYDYRLCNPELT